MPPPPGRPYNYSPTTVQARVPQEAGVYWLRSNQGVSYIGESKNLRRRISEHTVKDPVRFQFETVKSYCSRYGVMNHFWKSPKQMAHKIENTELTLYEKRFGRLPPLNKKGNNHRVDVFEAVIDRVYEETQNWWPSGSSGEFF